ncbi:uncharacterized protein VICG_01607 [Vittaforma corneae ATCC 50505]|uniref:Ribosome production factor 2 homolog n=1 Tax=Vittaforma corneae (strain ATCC 50505) TaxID=993615 RepID=L2GKI5_VITCO|nr:uncharacterized protein VICG_01607 [Vittaforma corneae ATCC 50505]ELA41366.1 hypothetical protein VICG_01607 [Vittaforma corneae ATCC 50505]
MRPKNPKARKNVLCLSKTMPKPLRELLTIRGDFLALEEDIDCFADYEKTCKLMKKKKCALSVASTKEHLVFVRVYDYQPLEILKFRISKSFSSADFGSVPAELYSKYFVICQQIENKRIENFLVDFFSQHSTKVNIDSVRYAWIIGQTSHQSERTFTLKYVRVLNDLSVEDIGPHFELVLEKEFYCGDELYEKAFACSQPAKQRNVSKNVFRDTVGKLHIDRQDLNDINLKKSRAYKKIEKSSEQ